MTTTFSGDGGGQDPQHPAKTAFNSVLAELHEKTSVQGIEDAGKRVPGAVETLLEIHGQDQKPDHNDAGVRQAVVAEPNCQAHNAGQAQNAALDLAKLTAQEDKDPPKPGSPGVTM